MWIFCCVALFRFPFHSSSNKLQVLQECATKKKEAQLFLFLVLTITLAIWRFNDLVNLWQCRQFMTNWKNSNHDIDQIDMTVRERHWTALTILTMFSTYSAVFWIKFQGIIYAFGRRKHLKSIQKVLLPCLVKAQNNHCKYISNI